MQRIARTVKSENNIQFIELFNRYDEVRRLLLRYLPLSTISIFARPLDKGEYIEWYTDLEGQPIALNNVKTDEKTTALLQQRLASVEQLINNKTIEPTYVELLAKLLRAIKHNGCQIYLINNEPVIIGWGIGDESVSDIPASVPIAPLSVFSYRWLWWLLFLLIVGFLTWWILSDQLIKPKSATPSAEAKAEIKAEPQEELKAEIKAEPKEEPKAELKVEEEKPKEEMKQEVKTAPKEEVKQELKKEAKEEIKQKPKAEPKIEKTPPKERTAKTEIKPGQVWSGTYMCPQGLTSIRFEIKKFAPNGDFTTVAHFKYDERRQGAVNMEGKFTNNTFFAKSISWAKYPEVGTWFLADFDGQYNPTTNRIEGRVIGDGCAAFTLKKIR